MGEAAPRLDPEGFERELQDILPVSISSWKELLRPDGEFKSAVAQKRYNVIPTMQAFHKDGAINRCIVGSIGSGKTTAAAFEICYALPTWLYRRFGIRETKWCVVRNTYGMLRDSTYKTVKNWFPNGIERVSEFSYILTLLDDIKVEILFRACDRAGDMDKFKGLELTGVWFDESIEIADPIKLILQGRIGRYPEAENWPLLGYDKRSYPIFDVRKFVIETTNPPDVTHPLYYQYKWLTPVPGPVPEKPPLDNHHGYWQPPRENEANLDPGYYDDLTNAYRDNIDWLEMYVEGKPGIIIRGKQVYNNFDKRIHVAQTPLVWAKGPLYRGWDNSGNVPAAVVVQLVQSRFGYQLQILREFFDDRANIVTFANRVVQECNILYPDAKWTDYADPAGFNEYSTRTGEFTSNAKLMRDEAHVNVQPSEQNLSVRITTIESQLAIRDGLLIDPSCIRVINGFIGGYCYSEIKSLPGTYSDQPEKNRFSHLHDATQYVCIKVLRTTKSAGAVESGWRPNRG
uniref:Putative terminase n=1 Tax=viral metagenome TaxID=1070528 RepID=A0A6M3JR76_9ZZZZ